MENPYVNCAAIGEILPELLLGKGGERSRRVSSQWLCRVKRICTGEKQLLPVYLPIRSDGVRSFSLSVGYRVMIRLVYLGGFRGTLTDAS